MTDTTDWGGAVAGYLGQQKQQASTNLLAAQQVEPDKAAMAQSLAPALGVPASVIEQDPQMWQGQFQLRANQATIGTDANLQAWLAANPANAKVAQDDIPQLGAVGRAWQSV